MTRMHHPDNERIKRRYLSFLKETRGFAEPTLDQVATAIDRFQTDTQFRDFKAFHIEQVKSFKRHLSEQLAVRTKEPLSHATIYSTLNTLKAFFEWLAGQPGYKKCFSFGDWQYFSPSGITASVAKAHRPRGAPTLAQVRHVIQSMPSQNEIERRDRALIAFVIVTGVRCTALTSLKLRHVDIERRVLFQDARVVKTKFRKTFETWFFPVGQELEALVIDWARFLIEEKLWGLDDPLFPNSRMAIGAAGHFERAGLDRKPWSSTGPIRAIFRDAFEAARLPYAHPHSFRHTLVALGRERCKSWAEMQAWAQNLGHESLTTTFGSYGKVGTHEQGDLVRNAGKERVSDAKRLDRLEALMTNWSGQQS